MWMAVKYAVGVRRLHTEVMSKRYWKRREKVKGERGPFGGARGRGRSAFTSTFHGSELSKVQHT